MRISIFQTNPTIGDIKKNACEISHIFSCHKNSNLLLFPELSLCGHIPYDYLEYETIITTQTEQLAFLSTQLDHHQTALVGGVFRKNDSLQNVIYAIQHNTIQVYSKRILEECDIFFEKRYFTSSKESHILNIKGIQFGLFICFDLWTQNKYSPLYSIKDKPIDALLWISASPYTKTKHLNRLALARSTVKKCKKPLIMVNLYGGNDEIVFDGKSFIMDSTGSCIHTLQHCKKDMCTLELTKSHIKIIQPSYTSEQHSTHSLTPSPCNITKNHTLSTTKDMPCEEILSVLKLGLSDYIAKAKIPSKIHLGLSGGIDSALTAYIATESMGPEAIHGVLLPSRHTHQTSIQDALALAKNLHIQTNTISIEDVHGITEKSLAPILSTNGITNENIQARIRGMMLMAYSNAYNSMLLTTGNKSEIAVGYCTLYGDMCGSINLIGDLYKTEIYTLCKYINKKHGYNIIPHSILTKEPTAELRENQKDSDSLPDYPILDAILYEYIENKHTPFEISKNSPYPFDLLMKIWRLLCQAEYKRYQAAPIIKISDKSFGRGRIMPIAAHPLL